MRKLVLVALLMLVFCQTDAQTHRYYCEVKGTAHSSVFNVTNVTIDFGTQYIDKVQGKSKEVPKIINENGEEAQFKDMVDAGNYLSERGWQLHQAYSAADLNGFIAHHWIFYKDAENQEKAMENILIKVETKRGKK